MKCIHCNTEIYPVAFFKTVIEYEIDILLNGGNFNIPDSGIYWMPENISESDKAIKTFEEVIDNGILCNHCGHEIEYIRDNENVVIVEGSPGYEKLLMLRKLS